MDNGFVIWITGLAGAGKTTISQELFLKLKKEYKNVVLLDGDVFRNIFQEERDFSLQGRLRVAKKISALYSFLSKNGLIVICATISLFDEIYKLNRQNIVNCLEVFVQCDFEELLKRDKKNLYTLAKQGKIKNVIGVDLEYDKPIPHYTINNSNKRDLKANVDSLYKRVKEFLSHSKNVDDLNYWEHYYSVRLKSEKETPFAEFCMKNFFKEGQTLIELGCGNGRDSIYFAKNHLKVTGIDQCSNIISYLKDNYENETLSFAVDDFANLEKNMKCDVVYSRFTLHSISVKEQEKVFEWAENALEEKGYFCIEARGHKNSLYKMGIPVEGEKDAFIFENHFRRFLDFKEVVNDLLERKFTIIYAAEERGFAPFSHGGGGDENDCFIRIIAQKQFLDYEVEVISNV